MCRCSPETGRELQSSDMEMKLNRQKCRQGGEHGVTAFASSCLESGLLLADMLQLLGTLQSILRLGEKSPAAEHGSGSVKMNEWAEA